MPNSSYKVRTAKHETLDANAVDTISLTDSSAYGSQAVEVFNHGTSDLIWFTTDGTTPQAKGDNNYFVLPGTGLKVTPPINSEFVIKLTCATSVDYSVTSVPN